MRIYSVLCTCVHYRARQGFVTESTWYRVTASNCRVVTQYLLWVVFSLIQCKFLLLCSHWGGGYVRYSYTVECLIVVILLKLRLVNEPGWQFLSRIFSINFFLLSLVGWLKWISNMAVIVNFIFRAGVKVSKSSCVHKHVNKIQSYSLLLQTHYCH